MAHGFNFEASELGCACALAIANVCDSHAHGARVGRGSRRFRSLMSWIWKIKYSGAPPSFLTNETDSKSK